MTRLIVSAILCLIVVCRPAAAATDSLAIGPRFHHDTGFDDNGMRGDHLAFGAPLPLYKTYPEAIRITLPPVTDGGASLATCLSARQSIRSYDTTAVTVEQLAAVLYAAAGLTHGRGEYAMRTAPSGGALYPIDIYLFATAVDGLEPGLYHYQVADSTLEFIRPGNFRKDLLSAANDQSAVGRAPVTFVLTARFARSTAKYADRGYRYVYMEAGAICQTIYLTATARQLGTVAVGAFNDEALNALLGIDGGDEAALLLMPIGPRPDGDK